jgi:uncharacterized protein (TIGR04255 family)
MNTQQQRYEKPPIVEAIIEIRFGQRIARRDLERARNRFKRAYPAVEDIQEVEMKVEGAKVETAYSVVGFKMTSKEGFDVVMILEYGLATVRRAPYEGWDRFIVQAKENFALYDKIVQRRDFARLGVRYINRLDIPDDQISGRALNTILNVHVEVPSNIAKFITKYALLAEFNEVTTEAKARVISQVLPPALLEHVSLQLDVDVYFDQDIQPRVDKVWELIEKLRTAKNAVFEGAIQEPLRKLFQ